MEHCDARDPVVRNDANHALVATVVLFGVLGIGAFVVNAVAPNEEILSGERLVPVAIYRPVFQTGLLLGVLAALVAALAASFLGSRPAWQVAGATSSFGLACVAGLMVLASIVPEWGSLGAQSSARVKSTVVSADKTFGLAVMFDRGSSELTQKARQTLKDNLAVFDSCAVSDIYVRGYASRRPFRETLVTGPPCDSNCRNNGLANRRAVAVHKHLQALGVNARDPVPWTNHDDMLSSARIMDAGPNGDLLPEKERLNQRAEIYWTETRCPVDRGSEAPAAEAPIARPAKATPKR